MIGDRNHLAVALLISVPLMNYLRMQSAHRIVQLGLMVAMGLTVLAAIGSQSRGALLALGATAAMLWWRSRGKIVSGIMIVACVAAVIGFMPDSWTQRMNTISDYEEDESAMGRIRIWKASWMLAVGHPFTGTGFRAPYNQEIVDTVSPGTVARAVHSIYFEVLGEHGFIGFAIWLGLTVAGAYYAWRLVALTRNRPDLSWASDLGRMIPVSIVAYLSGGAFLSLSYWDYYWTILLVAGSAHSVLLRQLQAEAPRRAQAVTASWRQASPQGVTT